MDALKAKRNWGVVGGYVSNAAALSDTNRLGCMELMYYRASDAVILSELNTNDITDEVIKNRYR